MYKCATIVRLVIFQYLLLLDLFSISVLEVSNKSPHSMLSLLGSLYKNLAFAQQAIPYLEQILAGLLVWHNSKSEQPLKRLKIGAKSELLGPFKRLKIGATVRGVIKSTPFNHEAKKNLNI